MGEAPGKQIDDSPMKSVAVVQPPPGKAAAVVSPPAKKYAAPDSPTGVTEEAEFSVRISVDDGGIASVELLAEEEEDDGAAEAEAPPDPEQMRLHEEFLEEQRTRKAQYEATQKVQAIAKGKAARAEVEAKRAERPATADVPAGAAPDDRPTTAPA